MSSTSNHDVPGAPPRRRGWREIALNFGAAAGVVCIVLAAVSIFFGITPLIFRSGSMSPTIGTGALAFAKTVPASDVQEGDIISVENAEGVSITHRVVSIDPSGDDAATVILKGDANMQADPLPYSITEVKKVFVHVPTLGYVVSWMSSRVAIFIGGVLAGVLMMLAFGPKRSISDTTQATNDEMPAGDAAPDELSPPQEGSHV